MNDERFRIFTGTANPVLAEAICKNLDVPLGKAMLGRFSDGEIAARVEGFRPKPYSPPTQPTLFEG